jgi:hypothetical protein
MRIGRSAAHGFWKGSAVFSDLLSAAGAVLDRSEVLFAAEGFQEFAERYGTGRFGSAL